MGGAGRGGYDNAYQGFNFGAYRPQARRTRPIPGGYMAGFGPEQRYFQGNNPAQYLTQYATDIAANNPDATPQDGASGSPQDSTNMGMPRPPFNPYAQSYQPMQPPGGGFDERERGFTNPPMFGGYGNPYMQRPSYQSFYGNPQMNGMINPCLLYTSPSPRD